MDVDWMQVLKWAGPIFGGICVGTVVPAARRAIRNRGKTDQEIAQEDLDRAFKRAEEAHVAAHAAHSNNDARDDAAADAAVAAADAAVEATRAALNKIRRARAVWDGIAAEVPKE